MRRALLPFVALVALTACGEKPQVLGGTRQDAPAFEGTGMPFTAGGWQAGDRASWESQLRARTQNGQNEYSKVN